MAYALAGTLAWQTTTMSSTGSSPSSMKRFWRVVVSAAPPSPEPGKGEMDMNTPPLAIYSPASPTLAFSDFTPKSLAIQGGVNGEPLVTIDLKDGKLTYGLHYK